MPLEQVRCRLLQGPVRQATILIQEKITRALAPLVTTSDQIRSRSWNRKKWTSLHKLDFEVSMRFSISTQIASLNMHVFLLTLVAQSVQEAACWKLSLIGSRLCTNCTVTFSDFSVWTVIYFIPTHTTSVSMFRSDFVLQNNSESVLERLR